MHVVLHQLWAYTLNKWAQATQHQIPLECSRKGDLAGTEDSMPQDAQQNAKEVEQINISPYASPKVSPESRT